MLMKKIEEFIHKSIAEPDNDEGLYHEQLLHNACQEVCEQEHPHQLAVTFHLLLVDIL